MRIRKKWLILFEFNNRHLPIIGADRPAVGRIGRLIDTDLLRVVSETLDLLRGEARMRTLRRIRRRVKLDELRTRLAGPRDAAPSPGFRSHK